MAKEIPNGEHSCGITKCVERCMCIYAVEGWEGGNCVGGAIVWRTAQWDGCGETVPDSTLLPFTATWCQVDKIHIHIPTTSYPPNKACVLCK